jgi:uncharacterized membrane protein YqhA
MALTEPAAAFDQRTDRRKPWYAEPLLRLLAISRYAIVVPVVGTMIAAMALLVYGALQALRVVAAAIPGAPTSDQPLEAPVMLLAIATVDAFLVAVVLMVIAVGLYQLFVKRLPLPRWLIVEDLDALDRKLISVVITVLAVVFLGHVVTWDGQRDLQGIGLATGVVIAALAYHVRER